MPAPALELSSFISIGLDMTVSLAEGGWTIVGGGEVGVVVDALGGWLEVILSSAFTVGGVVGRGERGERD